MAGNKETKKVLNTNSNTYIIIYSSVMVVIVAFLLAFISQALKPAQDSNCLLYTSPSPRD